MENNEKLKNKMGEIKKELETYKWGYKKIKEGDNLLYHELQKKEEKLEKLFSEEQKIKELLKVSEIKYRRLFEAAQDSILIINARSGKIENSNLFIEETLGYSKKELLGKEIWQISLFKDIVANKEKFIELQKKKYVRYKNLPLKSKKGKTVWVEFISNMYKIGSDDIVQCNIRDITEEKIAREKLKESEEKYVSLFEHAVDAIFIADPITRKIVDCNKAAEKITGYSRDKILSMRADDLHPKDKVKETMDDFKKQTEGKIKQTFSEILTVGKKRIPVSISAAIVHIGDKEYLQGMFRDITEQKKAELALIQAKEELEQRVLERTKELSESEKKYKSLFESSRDAVMTLAPPSWKFNGGNSAAVEMFHTKNEEKFVSLGPWDVSPQFQPDGQLSSLKAKKMIEKAMKEGSSFFEWTHKKLGDGDFPATVLLSRVLINGNTFLQATVRDISREKEAAEELKRSEIKNKELIETMSDGFGIINTKGVLTFVNKALCQMWGYSEKELIGRHVTDFVDEKNKKILQTEVATRKEGGSKQYEITWTGKNGIKVTTIVSPTPIFDSSGDHQGSFAVLTDITERKRINEEVVKSKEELSKKNEELERFNKLVVSRELKMIELKKKIEKLEKKE